MAIEVTMVSDRLANRLNAHIVLVARGPTLHHRRAEVRAQALPDGARRDRRLACDSQGRGSQTAQRYGARGAFHSVSLGRSALEGAGDAREVQHPHRGGVVRINSIAAVWDAHAKTDMASSFREHAIANRFAAVDRFDHADCSRFAAATGYGRRDLGSAGVA
jgi:hypothetical protein